MPPFGLDGVYISEPCPSYCSGHGDCVSGVCFCDLGYTGKAAGMSDDLFVKYPSLVTIFHVTSSKEIDSEFVLL